MPRAKVTAKDVAAAAGVSRATVSLVLRDSPLVAESTRARVLATMKELGYVYHRTAATLRSQRSHTIGLLVADVSNPFFAEMTVAVESELDGAGFVLLLGHNYESVDKQRRWLRVMEEYGVDGLLICPAEGTTPDMLQSLALADVPHVLVTRYVDDYPASVVAADNVLGARLAAQHLLDHGCRRIAFLGGPKFSSAWRDRRQGVVEVLLERGQKVSEQLFVPTVTTRQAGYEAGMPMLSSPSRPDGIVCFNDVVAIGVLAALNECGLRAGVDVRITGFDDIEEARLQRPALTTVAAHAQDVGKRAARLLNQMIEHETTEVTHDIIRPRLVIRASCGCEPRVEKPALRDR